MQIEHEFFVFFKLLFVYGLVSPNHYYYHEKRLQVKLHSKNLCDAIFTSHHNINYIKNAN